MRLTVRQAVPEDAPAIFDLLMRMGREMAPYSVNVDRVKQRIGQVFAEGAIFLALIDDEPVGTIGLLLERASWFTDDRIISDTWIYVDREKRPLRVFDALKRECMRLAEEMGIPLVFCLHTLVDTDRKAKLFARHAETIMKAWKWTLIGGEYRVRIGGG